jgi:hypothetical protein
MDLSDGGRHIPGVCLGHGLDGNIGTAADFHPTYINRLGNSALVHSDPYLNPVIGAAFVLGQYRSGNSTSGVLEVISKSRMARC